MNRASGARLAHTYYLSLLLDIYIRNGRITEARRVLDEAFVTAEATGETFWLAELHRLGGELAIASAADGSRSNAAEASFRQSLEIARAQGARPLEDRTARRLAALG
jgi:predicted ATPase